MILGGGGLCCTQQVAEEHLKFTTLHCMSYKWLLIWNPVYFFYKLVKQPIQLLYTVAELTLLTFFFSVDVLFSNTLVDRIN